jgi:carbonic anhydrase
MLPVIFRAGLLNYFWIGRSDIRVPAARIASLFPGDIFTHGNVANMVSVRIEPCSLR